MSNSIILSTCSLKMISNNFIVILIINVLREISSFIIIALLQEGKDTISSVKPKLIKCSSMNKPRHEQSV